MVTQVPYDGRIPQSHTTPLARSRSTLESTNATQHGLGVSKLAHVEMYPTPTEQEYLTLRKVADTIPHTAYLLCVVELCERASYYGASTVFSNFMQFPLPDGGNGAGAPARGSEDTAGALGKGLQFSNAMTLLFKFLAYIIPIFGGTFFSTETDFQLC